MKVGLLFGSYNPVHHGHLLLATRMREQAALDEVWLVVSPHNPHKEHADLAPQQHRLRMAELAVQDHPFLKVCAIEFSLPIPSYTHQTLKVLTTEFPSNQFQIIIGADNLEKFHTWKEAEWIKKHFEILVYDRMINHHSIDPAFKNISLPLIDISATEIRKRLQDQKTIRYFVPENVEKYLVQNHLYF